LFEIDISLNCIRLLYLCFHHSSLRRLSRQVLMSILEALVEMPMIVVWYWLLSYRGNASAICFKLIWKAQQQCLDNDRSRLLIWLGSCVGILLYMVLVPLHNLEITTHLRIYIGLVSPLRPEILTLNKTDRKTRNISKSWTCSTFQH